LRDPYCGVDTKPEVDLSAPDMGRGWTLAVAIERVRRGRFATSVGGGCGWSGASNATDRAARPWSTIRARHSGSALATIRENIGPWLVEMSFTNPISIFATSTDLRHQLSLHIRRSA
jgi:hypothetical protein